MTIALGVAAAAGTFAGIRKLEKLFGGRKPVVAEHYNVTSLDLFSRV